MGTGQWIFYADCPAQTQMAGLQLQATELGGTVSKVEQEEVELRNQVTTLESALKNSAPGKISTLKVQPPTADVQTRMQAACSRPLTGLLPTGANRPERQCSEGLGEMDPGPQEVSGGPEPAADQPAEDDA